MLAAEKAAQLVLGTEKVNPPARLRAVASTDLDSSQGSVAIPQHSQQWEKPKMLINRRGLQLDFSCLEGPAGKLFTEVMGHKIIQVPPMTVLRVYEGSYDAEVTGRGKLSTGGLERCVAKLDRALARDFPIEVHVVHGSKTAKPRQIISEPGWKGSIHIHPVVDLGVQPEKHSQLIRELARTVKADLIHLHGVPSQFTRLVSANAGSCGLAVTAHNGPLRQESLQNSSVVRATDLKVALDLLAKKIHYAGVLKGTYQFGVEVVEKVLRRIVKENNAMPVVFDAALKRASLSRYASTGLAAVSEHARTEFGDRHSVVIGDPMEPEVFNPANVTEDRKKELRDYFGVNDKAVLICHSRVELLKGQQFLPAVAARLVELGVEDFKILVIGPVKSDRFVRSIKKNIEKLGVSKHFHFEEGKSSEFIRDTLAISDLMLFPTMLEALGGASIEASLMKVPVVAHNVGGVPEAILDSQTGILVNPKDTLAMASACERLLRNEDQRLAMGEAGRAYASKKFGAQGIALAYMEQIYGPQVVPN